MINNFNHKILICFAVVGIGLLMFESVPSLADSHPQTKENFSSNLTQNDSSSNQSEQWLAQYGHQRMGWGNGSQYGRMYNSNTIETISGEVVAIDTFTPIGGMSQGMHLRLKTESETVDVHLGPAWYLENQEIKIQPNDQITVTGSRINFNGQSALITTQLHKGNQTLTLRDESGFPVWHGWRQRQPN